MIILSSHRNPSRFQDVDVEMNNPDGQNSTSSRNCDRNCSPELDDGENEVDFQHQVVNESPPPYDSLVHKIEDPPPSYNELIKKESIIGTCKVFK